MTPSGVKPYMFLDQNPANYVVEVGKKGAYFTRHLPTGRVAANVMPGGQTPNIAGGNMLLGANLVVGLVNVGIGAYNAYKIHQVQEDVNRSVEEIRGDIGYLNQNIEYQSNRIQAAIGFSHQIIESHLDSIEGVLKIQQRNLEVLAFHQWQLSEQMNLLRAEMKDGFNQVLRKVEDIDTQRQRDEFAKHTLLLHSKYKRFANFLLEASEAELFNQAIELEHTATELEVWLDVALSKIERGQPERLPLRVAQTYAVRAKADANIVRGGAYQREAQRDLNNFEESIRQEIHDLCNDKTLHYLGVEVPEVIAQYVYLYRGIARGSSFIVDDQLITSQELEWDDGLEILRDPFKDQGLELRNNLDLIGILKGIYPQYLKENFLNKFKNEFNIQDIEIKNKKEIIINKQITNQINDVEIYYSSVRNQIHDQLCIISREFPRQVINKLIEYNFLINCCCYFSNKWFITAISSDKKIQQIIFRNIDFKPSFIQQALREGYRILYINYAEKLSQWIYILVKYSNTPNDFSSLSNILPNVQSSIEELTRQNIIIDNFGVKVDSLKLTNYDFCIVSTSNNNYLSSQYLSKYTYLVNDQSTEINAALHDFLENMNKVNYKNFFLSDIKCGIDSYYLISELKSGILPKQTLIEESTFPVSEIQRYWNEGYNISHIAYYKSKWLVVMSDHNYPFEI